jgi:hypothetical protein
MERPDARRSACFLLPLLVLHLSILAPPRVALAQTAPPLPAPSGDSSAGNVLDDTTGKEEPPEKKRPPLRNLQEEGKEYHTPRAGEGFRTEVFGHLVEEQPRDRRRISAWDLGMAAVAPGVPGEEITPFFSTFFWRHPDDLTFLRAVVLGVYDEIYYAKSAEKIKPLEAVVTFDNYTVPIARREVIDGVRRKDEELSWGYARAGFGLGLRKQLEHPGHNDNMAAVALTFEPGYLYFDDGRKSAPGFVQPTDTFEGRAHLRLRLDKMERNLMEQAHSGYALGGDFLYGRRAEWKDWGIAASRDASSTRQYTSTSAYLVGASGVPFVESERHRLVGSLHAGIGDDLDRFSGFRIGGGPSGEEYESISRAVLPGALIEEFVTNRYAIGLGEYRWEPIFFTYLSVRSSVSYIRRQRERDGQRTDSDDVLASLGGRITTGFFFRTQLQLDYNYNTGVIRQGEFGGHEVVVHVSREF